MKNIKANDSQSRFSRRSRFWAAGVAAGLLLLAVALTALWQTRTGLAERVIADALAKRGIAPVSFQVSMLGLRSIEVSALTIGPSDATKGQQPDISAGRITVLYKLGELLSGRVQSIEIADLLVNARIDDHGLSLGAASSLLNEGGAGGGVGVLPEIHVASASVHLTTPQGPFALDGSIDISQSAAGAPIGISVPSMRVADRASSVRFEPIDFSGTVQLDGDILTAEAEGRSLSAKAQGVPLGKISGRYDLKAASGNAQLAGDLAFSPGKLEPQSLFPVLKGLMANVQGKAAYKADFSIAKGALRSSGQLALTQVGFDAYSAKVAGLNGTTKLSSLVPPRTSGTQTLSVAMLDAGIQLQNGRVRFEIANAALPHLVDAKWPFADGGLTLTSVKGSNTEFELLVENVDVAELLSLADVPGLSGTGTLNGTIPIAIENGNPIIKNGMLDAEKGGVIIYKSASADAAATNDQTRVLTDALKDFHYTELVGTLSGNANGDLLFHLRLRGANPALYDGYPIILNVNLQGSLADLIRRGTVGLRPLELIRSEIAPTKKAKP